MSRKPSNKGINQTALASLSLPKNPYAILQSPATLPCTSKDHVKTSNCSNNPWCVYGLGEEKEVSYFKVYSLLLYLYA